MTKWIFLESTWKGLLKNVQDRISKPVGGREIEKIKVYAVLLYVYVLLLAFVDIC